MTRLDIISCPLGLEDLGDEIKIFLAGPIQGAPDWQHSIPKIPGVRWISPRRENYDNFDYDEQTSWETMGLRISDAILFWIPASKENIEGRGYGQTTRIEFVTTAIIKFYSDGTIKCLIISNLKPLKHIHILHTIYKYIV